MDYEGKILRKLTVFLIGIALLFHFTQREGRIQAQEDTVDYQLFEEKVNKSTTAKIHSISDSLESGTGVKKSDTIKLDGAVIHSSKWMFQGSLIPVKQK